MNFSLFFDNIFLNLKGLYYVFLFSSTIFLLSSCSVTDNLPKDQYLLYRVKIKGNKNVSSEALQEINRQKPNRKILGTMPYLFLYYVGKKFYDSSDVYRKIEKAEEKFNQKIAETSKEKKKEKLQERKEKRLTKLNDKLKEGNWLMSAAGEPPVIYDSALTNLSTQQMEYYIRSKGFFNGKAESIVDTSGKKITVTYRIKEGLGYIVKDIKYKIDNDNIESIVINNLKHSDLVKGERYDEEKLSAERDRIYELIKNNGYYDFSRQFIFIDVDTTKEPKKVYLDIIIENPGKGKNHEQYTVTDVIFDADVTLPNSEKDDTLVYEDVKFILLGRNYSKRILENKIRIRPGNFYSQREIQVTQRNLASLDMFKFININFEKTRNDTVPNALTAYVRTSPLKKYQLTDEAGLTVSSQGFVPGPFGNVSFKTRNTFGGFEIFEISLKAAVEGYASYSDPDVPLITQEYTGNLSLTFPEFLFPIKAVRSLFDDFSPRTRVLAGATMISRPEFKRLNIKNSFSYNWMKNQFSTYNLSIIDLNIINTLDKSPDFEDLLQDLFLQGSNLLYSFNNSFVSNINYSYTFNNNQFGVNNKSRYFKALIEPGGTIFNIPGLAPNDSIFDLKTFRYVKGNVDLRYYFPIGKSTFAMRFHTGAVYPYDKEGVLPWEKYYFAGGSNSIRAWGPRRLGPGSFKGTDTVNGKIIEREQPGELLFETSYEYRFNIVSFFDGAVFLDAGNVWGLTEQSEAARPGSRFSISNFYEQIAVGTGFGLRLNFSFLILRFDLGIKAYDPSEPQGERFVLPNLFKKLPFGPKNQTTINIGIGYPF